MKYLVFIALLFTSMPVGAEVCIDTTTFTVELSTDDYKASLTSSLTKAKLLEQLYYTRWERDRNRLIWLEAVFSNMDLQEERDNIKLKYDELYKIIEACK
jgi:hypothetical protein